MHVCLHAHAHAQLYILYCETDPQVLMAEMGQRVPLVVLDLWVKLVPLVNLGRWESKA